MTRRSHTVVAALLVAAAFAGTSALQPSGTADAPDAASPAAKEPERQGMRARLQRRLEETRRAQDRLESALRALDEGAAPAEVRRHLRGSESEGREKPSGPRPKHGGPPGREGRDGPDVEGDPAFRMLHEHAPELAERLRRGMREDPRLARRVVSWLGPRLHEFAAERDPALMRLRIDELKEGMEIAEITRGLARAILTKEPEQDRIESEKARLRAAMERQHDLRLQIQHREIELLGERLERLRAEVSRGPEERERIIDGRLDEIVATIERYRGRGRRGDPNAQPPARSPEMGPATERGPATSESQETIDPGGI